MANPALFQGNGQIGVRAGSITNIGMYGYSRDAIGVLGTSQYGSAGVFRTDADRPGVHGRSYGTAVFGESLRGFTAPRGSGWGVHGKSRNNTGVLGESVSYADEERTGFGVHGISYRGIGVVGWGHVAADFQGPVNINGKLTIFNAPKPFKIDHPLDPQNKYLSHSAVESPEMKNVYDGVAQLEEDGTAWVVLDEWFEALNKDFRYQLTPVGGPAPDLHVAEEIYENNAFRIAGGEGGMKVSWQVTGTRKDPWAAANPFEVEEEKPQEERGRYLQPSLYGAPEEQSVMRARMGEMGEPPQPSQIEPPGAPPMPSREEMDWQELYDLRGQIEELKQGRVEDEQRRQLDELRQQIEELREELRRRK
jgi:hypothetical protein